MTSNQQFVVALTAAIFIGLPALGSFIASMTQLARQGAKDAVDTVRHDQTMQIAATIQDTVNGQRDKMLEVVSKSADATSAATAIVAEVAAQKVHP